MNAISNLYYACHILLEMSSQLHKGRREKKGERKEYEEDVFKRENKGFGTV